MSRLMTAVGVAGMLLGITLLLTGCGDSPTASKMGMESCKRSAMEEKVTGEMMEPGKMDGMMTGQKMSEGKMAEDKMDRK